MTENLATFLLGRAELRPGLRFGVVEDQVTLAEAVEVGRRIAGDLAAAGLGPGSRLGVIGDTSTEYLLLWIGCQLAGVEPALINPTYPDDLLGAMLEVLAPAAVATPDGVRRPAHPAGVSVLGFDGVRHGALRRDGTDLPGVAAASLPGMDRDELAVAGYMHTSGTTGLPKFCAQSHRYYLRLGRLLADQMALSPVDRVLAPLPMFHVNPLGYGFMGGLTGMSDVVAMRRFSPTGFWDMVREQGITALILHAPPGEILKRRTTAQDAAGHRIRTQFFADQDFVDTFGIPVAMSVYGSTEAAGLSHVWQWRNGERCDIPEGMSHYAGMPRNDIEWSLTEDGEILVRDREPGVMFSGYLRDGVLDPARDEDGWFHTGDLGRVDEAGRLIFIERFAESIRVKGEFVPIEHVERTFADTPGITDLALWKRPGELRDDEVVLMVVTDGEIPVAEINARAETLPRFMRPSWIARIPEVPRDAGAGKVQRRRLDLDAVEEWVQC